MKGTLYLSYWAILNKCTTPHTCRISTSVPRGITNYSKDLPALYPGNKLVYDFKQGNKTWREYVSTYVDALVSNKDSDRDLDFIADKLDAGEDVTIFCYDKHMPCHKFIIGQLFLNKGYSVKVIEGSDIRDMRNNEYLEY